MELIPDDPIIASILRTGYPPDFSNYPEEDDEYDPFYTDGDIFYGNQTPDF